MPKADLHVHTTASDGELTLSTLPAAARRADVDVVAVTDHDLLHPGLEAPVSTVDGVTVIRGVELRVEPADGERVDLLGYGARATAALRRELERVQRDRIERGRAIVEAVENRLGIDLGVEPTEGIGRPHVARAIEEHPGTDYDYDGAFAELIGNDCPCYVPRDVPSFERGRRLLAESCAVVALAHPLRYGDPDAALELAADLDAAELYYPYDRPVDRAPVERAIREHDLLATGGSDAHDGTLGRAGLSGEPFRRFRDALGGR